TVHGASRAALGDDLVTHFSNAELDRVRARLQHVDRVITVSESARDEVIQHYGVSSDRITVIHNGVGEGFHPGAANAAVLARYGIRQPFILTISTLKPKKNVAASVRTFAELRRRHPDLPHQLVLVGYKAAGYTEVDDAIRELGLETHVIQTGWTESAEIPTFYAAADLVLFPTLHEGFGLPIVEAMASGCPVAASGVFSVPEVGGNAIVTFDPADEAAMVEATERALFDRELREGLVSRGRERARRFTWADAARKTAAVYRELLGLA
ncbi:MAG TPA: glycosyltransferase family 1 protein, partial [Blastocatellia bacterium]|nr:glycosyltransferase family 1 protein [Blastocatellia bacterium]